MLNMLGLQYCTSTVGTSQTKVKTKIRHLAKGEVNQRGGREQVESLVEIFKIARFFLVLFPSLRNGTGFFYI